MAVLKFLPYRAMLQSKLAVCLVFVLLLALFFVENQVQQLHSSIRALERALDENTSRQVRNSNTITIQQGPANLPHDPSDLVVIYNRVPKTGSTSFTGVAYDLCATNKYNVIHINTTRNIHTMSLADQMRFVQNVTNWSVKKPAFYHGHVSFIDFASFGSIQQPLYINIIRRPLDRLVSYYYFLRFGDDFRPKLTRHRHSNKETFDECVARKGYDCAPEKLWIQVPFFCGHAHECWQPGSRWALEQAKRNLVNSYMLVGVTEEMQEFVTVLEATLPSMFKGATEHFQTGHKSHLRKTANKKPPSPDTIAQFETSDIWQVEEEFYNFVLENFHAIKKRTIKEVDGKAVPVAKQFMYEKVRPKT